jgi:hypothetical protein
MPRKKIDGQVEQPTDAAVQTDVSAAENQTSETIAANDAVAAADNTSPAENSVPESKFDSEPIAPTAFTSGPFANDAVAAAVAQAYKVKPQDQKFVHVLQEIKRFDPHTSDRISRPVVQMYGVREWDKIADYLKRQGYSLQVIHHPGK